MYSSNDNDNNDNNDGSDGAMGRVTLNPEALAWVM